MKLKLKKLRLAFILVAALLLSACSDVQESTSEFIRWHSYVDGMQAAGVQGKKVFLYFRADW